MESNELITLRHTLHKEPEISNQEFNTSARLKKFLEPTAPDIIVPVGETGFLVVYEAGDKGPTLVFRAELDALPIHEISKLPYRSGKKGVSHACGHDGHMTILAGLGQAIARNRPARGKAVLLFQHAEEIEQGARDVVNNKEFTSLNPDYLFALHNIPGEEMHRIIVRKGTMTAASRGMTVKLTGKSSHAAEPEKGINPALSIARIIQSLEGLKNESRLFKSPVLITVINIRMGEISFGTSPGYGELRCTLRAFDNEDMAILVSEAEKLMRQSASELKLKSEISYSEEFPATENDPDCVEMVKKAARDNGLPLVEAVAPYLWSEDFGYYTGSYSGCLFGLGSGSTQAALHNPDYDFPDALIGTGVKMFQNIYKNLLL